MHRWQLSINGERLFLKGANLAPTRAALAEATPDEVRRDIVLAADAGLDLVRVHAHIGRPELYDAADDLGVLVWQDLPLQWGYARAVGRSAVRQAAEAVDLLGHHPSIALWCGHNEPIALDIEPGTPVDDRRVLARYVVGQELPTWNRTILDGRLRRALERADETRPVIAHSGIVPHFPQLDGTDSHLYFGWYHGHERDLPGFAATVPRMVRFVGEFGAQAVPDSADFCDPQHWPNLDWERLNRHHALQKHVFDERVPPGEFSTFDAWRQATQQYQATVLKHHIEHLRRLKYAPTGGFCFFLLNDAQPAISWSVLDHERMAKLGYGAVTDACRPVVVVADRLPPALDPGQALALDLHVVSDLRRPLEDVTAGATLRWPGGQHRWRWQGEVPADACVRIDTIQFVVPDAAGELVLDLELTGSDVAATNRYAAPILRT
jgi:beta-mannosidase